MDILQVLREIFNYGVPTAILFITAYGIYKTTGWLRDKVVEPVTKSHLELIETLKVHMPKQSEAINGLLEQSVKQTSSLDKQTDRMEQLRNQEGDLFTKVIENQGSIIKKLDGGQNELLRSEVQKVAEQVKMGVDDMKDSVKKAAEHAADQVIKVVIKAAGNYDSTNKQE